MNATGLRESSSSSCFCGRGGRSRMSARVSRARLFAFDVLWRVEAEAAYAGHLLTSERGESLARADRALAYELALGVLRSRLLLDFLISRYARRPVAKLDPE